MMHNPTPDVGTLDALARKVVRAALKWERRRAVLWAVKVKANGYAPEVDDDPEADELCSAVAVYRDALIEESVPDADPPAVEAAPATTPEKSTLDEMPF
jgi:hypothetical protein